MRISNQVIVVAVVGAVVGLAVLCYGNPYYVDVETKKKARLYDRFCSATRMAMREDAAAFAGALQEREDALRRFYVSRVVYHGSESVALCLDDRLPQAPSDCFLTEDWECLAGFARTLEKSLAASGSDSAPKPAATLTLPRSSPPRSVEQKSEPEVKGDDAAVVDEQEPAKPKPKPKLKLKSRGAGSASTPPPTTTVKPPAPLLDDDDDAPMR